MNLRNKVLSLKNGRQPIKVLAFVLTKIITNYTLNKEK